MSEKCGLPGYGQMTSNPPPYTPFQQQPPVILVDVKSGFHEGARFNEFAKPNIPPPPPGCAPNHLQLFQMERGVSEVVFIDSRKDGKICHR